MFGRAELYLFMRFSLNCRNFLSAVNKLMSRQTDIWDKVFKNAPSKIFGRQPLSA